MTKITLSAIVTATMLLGSATAMADSFNNQNINNVHNIAKRPYQQLADASAYQASESWVGAGVTSAQTATEGNQKQLRLNMLSKRPYM